MELILRRDVESSCLATHNIVPNISWHDPPCHWTTKKYADFPSMVMFQLLLRKFWIQTSFCNCQQYLCLFHIVFECTQGIHYLRKMLVLPNQLLYLSTFHIGLMFCFFPASLISCRYTDKNSPFICLRVIIHNLELFPKRVPIELSRIAFPHSLSCQRITVQIPFKRNDWVFLSGP